MPSIFKTLLFGLGAFSIFILIALALKVFSKQITTETDYMTIFTQTDILLGLAVALVVTLTRERRKKLK